MDSQDLKPSLRDLKFQTTTTTVKLPIKKIKMKKKESIFPCTGCSRVFDSFVARRSHSRYCLGYKCDECNNFFITPNSLRIHKLSHQYITVPSPNEPPKSQEVLINNFDINYIEMPAVKNEVGFFNFGKETTQVYGGLDFVKEEVVTLEDDEDDYCPTETLEMHKEIKTEEKLEVSTLPDEKPNISKPFENNSLWCDLCNGKFVSIRKLLSHDCSGKYNCPICRAPNESAAALEFHRQTHKVKDKNDPQPFRCNQCGGRFKEFAYLKKHIVRIHVDTGRTHVCVHCNSAFKEWDKLMRHVKSCTKEYKPEKRNESNSD